MGVGGTAFAFALLTVLAVSPVSGSYKVQQGHTPLAIDSKVEQIAEFALSEFNRIHIGYNYGAMTVGTKRPLSNNLVSRLIQLYLR